ncbi:hypothetical protein CBM2626_A40324 [Cupriavidus taiwanensis]|nr:hypothetical protein CBM2626_A40324 [Cupriavidus taiwanensis]
MKLAPVSEAIASKRQLAGGEYILATGQGSASALTPFGVGALPPRISTNNKHFVLRIYCGRRMVDKSR